MCVCVDDGYLAKKTTMGRCVISTVGRQMWPRSTIVGVGIVVGGLGLFLCIIMGDDLVIFIFWVYQNKSW